MIRGSGGSKRRVAKAAGAEVAVQHFQVKTDHFLKFICRKIARRCGAKHVCKSKCAKHRILGPLFEVQMSKNGTPLWRQARLQIKMNKISMF